MKKIITITFNPCIDKSTTIPVIEPEKKLKCTEPCFEPGGGGINVARALKRLGHDSLAIYPAGGYSGKFLTELLHKEKIAVHPIETSNHTRENLIVLEQSTNKQYRFGMPGSFLLPSEWEHCLSLLQTAEADYFVVSGSLSPGVPNNIIARIARISKERNIKLVVDTSGPALKHALDEGVYLVKPNLNELGSLKGTEVTIENAALHAKELIEKGQAEIVIVSLGASGALLVTQKHSLHIESPIVKIQSTVGAGDSMVAGIVFALSNGWDIIKAVKYGVACGSAATMNPGTELCHLKDVEVLFKMMDKYHVTI